MAISAKYGISANLGITGHLSVLSDYGVDSGDAGDKAIVPLNIPSFVTSPGTSQAHTFTYPTDQIKTMFTGAKIQIQISGGTSPYIFTSSDTNIATVDSNGLVTLHDAKSFTITVSDNSGKVGSFSQAPSLYFYNTPAQQAWADANNDAFSRGGRLPAARESTPATAGSRVTGSLFGEWGDFYYNNSGWTFSGSSYYWWTATPYSTGYHEANSRSGQETNYADTTLLNALVYILDHGEPMAKVQMVNNVMLVAVLKGNEGG